MAGELPPSEHPPLRVPRPRRWMSVFMGVLLLICGAVIGGSITGVYLFQRFLDVVHHPEEVPARLVSRMAWQYGLSDDQTRKIEAIMTEGQRRLVAIRDRAYPEVATVLDETKAQVMQVLDEKQQERFNRKFDQIRKTLVALPAE